MEMVSIPHSRVLNLTTLILHTNMMDIYEDIGQITGMEGIMTHQIPAAAEALLPHLRRHLWNDPVWNEDLGAANHEDQPVYRIPVLEGEDRARFLKEYERIHKEVMAGVH